MGPEAKLSGELVATLASDMEETGNATELFVDSTCLVNTVKQRKLIEILLLAYFGFNCLMNVKQTKRRGGAKATDCQRWKASAASDADATMPGALECYG